MFVVRLAMGGVVISGGQDWNVRVWDATSDSTDCCVTLPHGANVRGLAASPHGFIASAGGKKTRVVAVWEPAPAKSKWFR